MAIAKCQRANILPLRARCSICILSNRKISSAIWDKSAEVSFSKTNKIARARGQIAICGLWKIYECWSIPKCTGKIMWLLDNNIHCMQKFDLRISSFTCHLAPFVTAPCSCLQMTTSIKIGQNFDRWILVDKNAAARNLFIENWSLLSFAFWTVHVFPLPPLKEIQLLKRLEIGHTLVDGPRGFFCQTIACGKMTLFWEADQLEDEDCMSYIFDDIKLFFPGVAVHLISTILQLPTEMGDGSGFFFVVVVVVVRG